MIKRVAMHSVGFLTRTSRLTPRVHTKNRHMKVSRLKKPARSMVKAIRSRRSRMDYINFNLREMGERVD